MTIIVDSRRCGSGKTYDNHPDRVKDDRTGDILSTYSRIKDAYDSSIKSLVVLPSIALCEQYEIVLNEHIENNFNGALNPQRHLSVLHSEKNNNVQAELQVALNDGDNYIIVITQATFLNSDISNSYRQNRYLIIDEAIEPYREQTIYHDKTSLVDFDLSNNCSIFEPPDTAIAWNQIRFKNLSGNSFVDSGKLAHELEHPNWINRCKHTDTEKLTGIIPKAERITVIQELSPTLFANWNNIWIAAANFEITFMRYYFERHKITWHIHPKLQFERHKTPLHLYTSEDLIWSSYKKQNYPHLLQEFASQAIPVHQKNVVAVLRNNDMPEIFENEQKLKHNSAGDNSFRHIGNVSVESALNATPVLNQFLHDIHEAEFDGKGSSIVHMARTVYCFYQAIMRSCLRDNKPAVVTCIDKRVLEGLVELFDNLFVDGIFTYTMPEKKKSGRKPTSDSGVAMTSAERQRKRRALLKQQENA